MQPIKASLSGPEPRQRAVMHRAEYLIELPRLAAVHATHASCQDSMKKSLQISLSICRRGDAIHLYLKNGKTRDRLSSVNSKPKSARRHVHLYRHLDRLLKEEGR